MVDMVDPFRGVSNTLANMPKIWRPVTPHATNFLREQGELPVVAIALYTFDGGTIVYHDVESLIEGTPMEIDLLPGASIVGQFVKVLDTTTATQIWAAFM